MNALFLKDLAQKTRRGLQGRVLQGLSGGGLCYGYDIVPGDTGVRRINKTEAEVIRAIFHDYAAGLSPRAIAKKLNQKGVPGPSGRLWRDTTIRGHVTRGTGILNNELYVGRLVWNRLTYLKDPKTGRRRSRLNSPDLWILQEVPALRIVEDDVWDAVKARQGAIRESDRVANARATRFWERRRSRHLLSGLVQCGKCGSRYASIGRDYLACSSARGSGTCSNRQSIRRSALEGMILEGLKQRLMEPKLVEEFVRAFQREVNSQRREQDLLVDATKRELAEVKRKLNGLIDAIAEGLRTPGLQKRLEELESRRAELEQEMTSACAPPIRLHPSLAQVYRRKVEQLQQALNDPEIRDEAIEVLRNLLESVVIAPADGGLEIEIVGEIAHMIEMGMEDGKRKGPVLPVLNESTARSVKVVAGACNHRELTLPPIPI
jgi:hypothetical protein